MQLFDRYYFFRGGMRIADNFLFLSKKKEMYSLMFVSNTMKNDLNMNGVSYLKPFVYLFFY